MPSHICKIARARARAKYYTDVYLSQTNADLSPSQLPSIIVSITIIINNIIIIASELAIQNNRNGQILSIVSLFTVLIFVPSKIRKVKSKELQLRNVKWTPPTHTRHAVVPCVYYILVVIFSIRILDLNCGKSRPCGQFLYDLLKHSLCKCR